MLPIVLGGSYFFSNIALMHTLHNKKIKIAVVGPESTGKSTMAQFLAKELKTLCVPEYARYYCKHLNNSYTPQDELNMFYGQLALEDAILASTTSDIIICDTTIMTVKIWSDHLFGDTPLNVKTEINQRYYDLYLLMDIDLPWEDDPLRDFPNQREHFMTIWKRELEAINAKYTLISSTDEKRLLEGKKNVLDFLKNTHL